MKDNKENLYDILPDDLRKDLMYIQNIGKKLYPDLEPVTLSEFLEFIPNEYHHYYVAQLKAS